MSKKVVSPADFEKEVEKEYCHLVYFDYMKKHDAWTKAREVVSQSYEVGRTS